MALTTAAGQPTRTSRSVAARLLEVAESLTTPLVPDDYLGLLNPLWSGRETYGRVTEVRRETADATTLAIRPGRGWSAPAAGQWVVVGVQIDGVWRSRTYSVTSASTGGSGPFSVTVKAMPGGLVSPYLAHRVEPGALVRLGQPQGEFCLPAVTPRALFLTGGSGITPVMGMLRTLAARGESADIMHVHSALHRDDVIFGDELRDRATGTSYRLHEQHTDIDGFFELAALDEICPDWRDREVWACGPVGMLEAIEAHWAAAGLTDALHIERFRAPVFAAADDDGGTVTFTATDRVAEAPGGTPLLEVGEAAGVVMPHGCRMGICFSCVAPLRSGQVRDLRTGEVHGREGEMIQTCVSAAAGPCSIDL